MALTITQNLSNNLNSIAL